MITIPTYSIDLVLNFYVEFYLMQVIKIKAQFLKKKKTKLKYLLYQSTFIYFDKNDCLEFMKTNKNKT